MTLTPCVDCDTLTENSRCPEHRPPSSPHLKRDPRDYDQAWRKLSERARKLQPFCLWCASTDDLQADHTPTAWEAKAQGKPITLAMIRVLCGPCNREAGQAKPGPGQRTTEERPDRQNNTGLGRLINPGGNPLNRGVPRRGVRQSLSSSPGALAVGSVNGPVYALVAPW